MLREKCSVSLGHTVHDTYKLIDNMKNRGEESTGMGGLTESGIDVIKWIGGVKKYNLEQLVKTLHGKMFVGHGRYSTSGKKEKLLPNAHPHKLGGRDKIRANHTITRNARFAAVHNGNIPDVDFLQKNLTEELFSDCDTELALRYYKSFGEERLMNDIPGSYALIFLDWRKNYAIVMRDRFGFKPLWIGEKDGKYVAASEDIAIKEIGGIPIREVREGEIIYINGPQFWSKQVVEPCPHFCFFEFNYFARWESVFNKRRVLEVRYGLGEELQKEFCPPDADFVTYVPKTPIPMARGYSDPTVARYSNTSGIEYMEVFYKLEEEKRSFLEPTQRQRKISLEENLYIYDNVDLEGKTLIIIDDSIVRSNVLERAIELCKQKGVKKVYFLSATPMIGKPIGDEERGCLFGIDMPPGDEFAAAKYETVKEMEEKLSKRYRIEVKIHYIQRDNMVRAYNGLPEDNFCFYCIGGENPIKQHFKRAA